MIERRRKTSVVLLSSVIAFARVASGEAAVVTAASCQQADVQAAVNAAAHGDTVEIPAGTCEWSTTSGTSGSNWKAAVQIVGKTIHLKGAGVGVTTIVNRVPYAWNTAAIHIGVPSSKTVRVSDLTIADLSTEVCAHYVLVDGSGTFRLDHSTIAVSANKFGGYRYVIFLYSYGLIDHCTLANALVAFANGADDGAASWSTPLSLGTGAAAFVEDCTIGYDGPAHGQQEDFIDGAAGARVVVRHNTVTNGQFHFHGIESGAARGILSYELYGNTLISDGTVNNYRKGYMRGGTGAIFDNTWVGSWPASPFYVVHQCLTIQKDPNDHRCDGPKWCYRYPCKDQIGRAPDADSSGTQDLVPLFAWNNKVGGSDVLLQVQADYCPDCLTYIQENRDYHNNTVTFDPIAKHYTATYRDDGGTTRQWLYRPYIHPHPLAAAPFGTVICGEGAITSPCWCQGAVRSDGTCEHGYYSAQLPPDATAFRPLTPCRALDTRLGSGAGAAAPILAAHERRVFTIAGWCGVPANAQAISANLTVVSAQALGDLRVTGGHVAATITSALSIPLARARANNAIVRLSTSGDGTIAVTNDSGGSVHFILDVNGYFQ
jgi:hypothetical protein